MIIYSKRDGRFTKTEGSADQPIPADAVWIDLHNLTPEEERKVENFLGLDVPSREEMAEIEVSNRLYEENGVLFMTATLVTQSDAPVPETHAITFILTKDRLVTVRYTDSFAFHTFAERLTRQESPNCEPCPILLGLIEAIINRMADILERSGREIDLEHRKLFQHEGQRREHRYHAILHKIGRTGDLVSKTRESITTLNRLVGFLQQSHRMDEGQEGQMKAQHKDLLALSDHATFLTNRVNFLLDATLGMISMEQNDIIKIFSVAAVMFLPPTLVASVYGMNFHFMPELDWHYGYPLALTLMFISAAVPFLYFKRKGWF